MLPTKGNLSSWNYWFSLRAKLPAIIFAFVVVALALVPAGFRPIINLKSHKIVGTYIAFPLGIEAWVLAILSSTMLALALTIFTDAHRSTLYTRGIYSRIEISRLNKAKTWGQLGWRFGDFSRIEHLPCYLTHRGVVCAIATWSSSEPSLSCKRLSAGLNRRERRTLRLKIAGHILSLDNGTSSRAICVDLLNDSGYVVIRPYIYSSEISYVASELPWILSILRNQPNGTVLTRGHRIGAAARWESGSDIEWASLTKHFCFRGITSSGNRVFRVSHPALMRIRSIAESKKFAYHVSRGGTAIISVKKNPELGVLKVYRSENAGDLPVWAVQAKQSGLYA